MNKFLLTRITYEQNYTIKDMLNEMCKDIIIWINNTSNLDHDYDIDTFKNKFYQFMYNTYHIHQNINSNPYDEELYLYFSMKFTQDIVDLFIRWKDLTTSYNLSLLHHYKDTSLPLLDFIFNHVLLEDPYNDDENEIESEEENYINYNIDE